jgi:hypothetical protein
MRKERIVLLLVCVLIAVTASYEVLAFKSSLAAASINQDKNDSPSQESRSISNSSMPTKESVLNLSAHENETVVIEGRIVGPLCFIPEGMPPWNYQIYDNGTMYGVFWNGQEPYNYTYVRVCGVITKGEYGGGVVFPSPVVYYIKATRIEVLDG